MRRIFSSRFERCGDRLIYRVRGSGFLKHMVRNLTGTLLELGKGNLGEIELKNWLTAPPGVKAGPTLPGCGLFLVGVEYPQDLANPPNTPAPPP